MRFGLNERLYDVGLAQRTQDVENVAVEVIRCGLIVKQEREDNKTQENDEMQPSTRMLLTCSIHQSLHPVRAKRELEGSSSPRLSLSNQSCGGPDGMAAGDMTSPKTFVELTLISVKPPQDKG